MGQHAARINIDGVTAWRLDDGNAVVGDVAAQVAGGRDTVAQVVRLQHFFEASCNGVEIAAGQAAVGGEALSKNQQVVFELSEAVVIGGKESANVGESVFLRGECAAIGQGKHLLRNLFG